MNYAMSQRHNWNASQIKKISSEPSGEGHTFPGKNAAGNGFLSKYEISIGFVASVTTSEDNFFMAWFHTIKILVLWLWVTVRYT